jgi:hypothetical protein
MTTGRRGAESHASDTLEHIILTCPEAASVRKVLSESTKDGAYRDRRRRAKSVRLASEDACHVSIALSRDQQTLKGSINVNK